MLEEVRRRAADLTTQLGRAALHHLYPNDFEYYAVAFELLDSRGRQQLYLLFPVMPSEITINSAPPTSVTRTQGGTYSVISPTDAPTDISLSGTFGRKFRLLATGFNADLGNAFVSGPLASPATAGQGTLRQGLEGGARLLQSFSKTVKTGYGVTKLLTTLLDTSRLPDADGNPHQLYFYNLAYNDQYLVENVGYTLRQSEQENMMWRYQIALRTLAPASNVRDALNGKASIVHTLAADQLQRATSKLAADALGRINKGRNQLALALTPAGKQQLRTASRGAGGDFQGAVAAVTQFLR